MSSVGRHVNSDRPRQMAHWRSSPVAPHGKRHTLQRVAPMRTSAEASDAAAIATSTPQVTQLPTRMNATPHTREMRRFFYTDASDSVLRALAAGESRITMRFTIPETNPEMDVYRIGTFLELTRELATRIAEDGRRVKVCVQGSMGEGVFQGLPLSLSGVSRIMKAMDWGDIVEQVTFGEVSGEDADDPADVFLLLAPQNVVGNTIMTNLSDMVVGAEAAGKQLVLLNPSLKDVPSSSGVMGIRGRETRIALDKSFTPAYHFRLLYFSGMFYPIVGALRYEFGGKWQIYKRKDLSRKEEEYQLWGEFDCEPDGRQITQVFKNKVPLLLRGLAAEDKKPNSGKWW